MKITNGYTKSLLTVQPYLWTERLNGRKKSVLQKLVNKFKAILIKNAIGFFIDNLVLKLIWRRNLKNNDLPYIIPRLFINDMLHII